MNLSADTLHVRLGRREVLHGIDLEAEPGQTLAIIGPNGAGKSTLLRTAAGILQPTRGTIRLGGKGLQEFKTRERAQQIGLVPQEHRIRYPFTVEEIVRMGRYAHRGPLAGARRDDHERVEAALEKTRIEHLRRRDASTLSGGERQRMMIARVLAQDPAVVLFDEPTASLDLAQAHHVQRLIHDLAEQGKTVVVVLHDLEQASRIAKQAVLLDHGQVIAHGDVQQVIAAEPIRQAYGVDVDIAWEENGQGARIKVVTAASPAGS